MKILVLCTGNSCRSQMAEGFLRSFNPNLTVLSAGIKPETQVNPYAIRVMEESGIDIGTHHPKNVTVFINESFDFVITVCDHAREVCPVFTGTVKHWLHIGFEDPADATGTNEEILLVYRRVRNQIKSEMLRFFKENFT